MSELRQAQALRDHLATQSAQLVQLLQSLWTSEEDAEKRIEDVTKSLEVVSAEFAEQLRPILSKLLSRATKPPETRIINAATCECIFALQAWASEFEQDLLRQRDELARGNNVLAQKRQRATIDAKFVASLSAVADEESKERSDVCAKEQSALKAIATQSHQQLKKTATLAKRDKRRFAEARQHVADEEFLRPFTKGLSQEEAIGDAALRLLADAEDEADLVESDEAEAWRSLDESAQQELSAIASRQGNARCVARVPLFSFLELRKGEWQLEKNENAQHSFSRGPQEVRVWRCLVNCGILKMTETVHPSYTLGVSHGLIAVVLAHGGYFCGAVYDTERTEFVLHKTFSRYIVRKGQGGRQSSHEGRTDTAGSQLRAKEEAKWVTEVEQLIISWRAVLGKCLLIVHHAPGKQNTQMLQKAGLFAVDGPHVARVPFATGRPIFAEAQYVVRTLLSLSLVLPPRLV